MTRIEFKIVGKPPKKIRGKSSWTSDSQAEPIKELRKAAYLASKSSKIELIKGSISIEIDIYLPNSFNNPSRPELFWGDLDNIISGICESFKRAPPNFPFFMEDSSEGESLFYYDDSQIDSIKAKKHVVSDNEPAYYTIAIEEFSLV